MMTEDERSMDLADTIVPCGPRRGSRLGVQGMTYSGLRRMVYLFGALSMLQTMGRNPYPRFLKRLHDFLGQDHFQVDLEHSLGDVVFDATANGGIE